MATNIKGLEEILQTLEDMGDTSETEMAMAKACALVERAAKQYAPKDTGALRNSITSKVEKDGNNIIGVVFTPLEYAPYIEYGTGLFAENGGRKDVPWNYQDDKGEWHSTNGQQPQPFLRPALADNRDKIKEILEESVKNG